jgi:hypothetical protein
MVWRAMEWCAAADCSERVVTRALGDLHRVSSTSRRDTEVTNDDGVFSPPWFGNAVLLAAFLRAVEARLLPQRFGRRFGVLLSTVELEHRAEWHSLVSSALTSNATPLTTLAECIDAKYCGAIVASVLRVESDEWRGELRSLLQRVYVRCGPAVRARIWRAARFELVAFVHEGCGRSGGGAIVLDFSPPPKGGELSPLFALDAPPALRVEPTPLDHVRPRGIASLLSVLAVAVEGFPRPLEAHRKEYLECVLMPLHGAQAAVLCEYHDALQFTVARYARFDAECAVFVVTALATAWPTRSSRKAGLFLAELEVIAAAADEERSTRIARPLLSVLARCIASPHFLVALRALAFWDNPDLVESGCLAPKFDSRVLLSTYPALNETSQNHFHADVRAAAQGVIDTYSERNRMLVRSTHRRALETREGTALARAARQKKWDGMQLL